MGFRKCSKHGWLATHEYTVSASGETICPECGKPLTGFSMDQPRSYDGPKGIDQIYGSGNPKTCDFEM